MCSPRAEYIGGADAAPDAPIYSSPMCSQIHAAPSTDLSFGSAVVHRNLSTAALIERAIRNGEGDLAANGALNVDTGDRTGRSPNDKFLEDT